MSYIEWLAATALVATSAVMVVVLLRRDAPKIKYFCLMALSSVAYLVGYWMEISAPSYDAAYYAVIIEYLGVPYIAPWTLLFVLDLHNCPIKKWYALLFAYPLTETILVATWPMNGIFYGGAHFEEGARLSYLHVDTTPLHTLALLYMFLLIMLSFVFVMRYIIKEGRAARRREYLILTALASPFVGLVLYATSIIPYDLTPIGIAVTIVLIFYSVFRYNQLNLLPNAKAQILENMEDAYLLVDDEWRYFDANQQARTLFPELQSLVYGSNLSVISDVEALKQALDTQNELILEREGVRRSYRPSLTQVAVSSKKPYSCILLYENTDTWQKMGELQQQADYDNLTGIYNRGTYIRLAKMAVESAKASRTPLAIMMFDMDYFKEVNDTHGHQCGDMVLRETAQRIGKRLRQSDIFGRYGGEEFSVCLPNITEENAVSVANSLCQIVANAPFIYKEAQVAVTVSIGVCFYDGKSDTNIDALLNHADEALYLAKTGGRNHVRHCRVMEALPS